MVRYKKSCQDRQEFSHPIVFPENLPISNHIEEIQQAVLAHQVIIVVGETGSGKTTQLPKLCLQLGRGRTGTIVHTQPRRLAAKGITQRLQHELGQPDAVGLKIRFEDKTSADNYIQVMTDGLLLNSFAHDPLLRWCDTLIIDEAHERSLNIDFLLGLVKQLLQKRPEFRLIITSATIKHHLFSEFFKNAPVFTVSGRTYPVDIRYLGPDYWGGHHPDPKISAVIEAVSQIYSASKHGSSIVSHDALDTLVFLPGERQIHDTAQALKRVFKEKFDILPLYARLASGAQSKVFHPASRTRIVISTNLAETSITVPRIGYVIDSGLVRMSRYSQRRKVQLLPIEPISQASAAQRAGRCGRIAPGVCYRLYDEQDFVTREEYPEAEIHRTHLAGVILQMKAMRLAEPADFPFLEAPALKMINDGYQLLEELGAVEQRKLTSIGRKMSRLPVDPRIARMILGSSECLYEMLIVASAMSVMEVLDIPREAREAGRQRHGQFQSKQSDFISKVLLWHRLEWYRQNLTRKEFALYCEKNFISIARFYEWRDVHKQLKLLVTQGSKETEREQLLPQTSWARYLVEELKKSNIDEPYLEWSQHLTAGCNAAIHQPIIAAFATQVAVADPESGGYISCRQRLCFIHPSAVVKGIKKADPRAQERQAKLKKAAPKAGQWIVVGEFLETQKLWARQIAHVQVDWILPHVEHLVRYAYAEPVWSKKMGAVVAHRSTSLFGLSLKQKEQVLFSHIDSEACREIFIQSAFVEQQLGESRFDHTLIDFIQVNQEMISHVEYLEAKARTSGLMATDQEIYQFFNSVIPPEIIDRRSFFSWWKKHRKQQPELLHFSKDWFIKNHQSLDDFPSALNIFGDVYQLEYSFDPGQQHDGVTIILPEAKLYDVNAAILEWLVPGLRREKCEALIRGLPKQERKKFVPISQFVDSFLAAGFEVTEPLTLCLEEFLHKMTGHRSTRLPWPGHDDYLCMKIRLVDGSGDTIAEHNNLEQLRLMRQRKVSLSVEKPSLKSDVARDSASSEEKPINRPISKISELPDLLALDHDAKVCKYTTLSLPDDSGQVHLITTPDLIQAEHLLHQGMLHLLQVQTNSLVKKIKRDFMKEPDIRRMVSGFKIEDEINDPALTDQQKHDYFWSCFMVANFERVFDLSSLPRSAQEGRVFFEPRSELISSVEKGVKTALSVAKLYSGIARKIKFLSQKKTSSKTQLEQDLIHQFDVLFSFEWLSGPSQFRIQTWAVLVQGLDHRLEKLTQRAGRDEADAAQVIQLQSHLNSFAATLTSKPMKLVREFARLQWALEGVRLALFSQQLKLSPKVSLKGFQKDLQQFEIALRKA